MKKTWKFTYKGNEIVVINTWQNEQLFVNGELQDEQNGYAGRSRLWGHVENRIGERETVKVSIGSGGWGGIICVVFIDNQLVFRSNSKKYRELRRFANN